MPVFHFKNFSVTNELSAMKVNTDGVLLGAAMTLDPGDGRLLDVGTGTGVIALMAAQRMASFAAASEGADFKIDAIDIDEPSAREAAANFLSSPWHGHLAAIHKSLTGFHPASTYDRIFSNPPYFDNSLTNPDMRKTDARHTSSLSYRELFEFACSYLDKEGSLSMILPYEESNRLLREGRYFGFFPFKMTGVKTTPTKPYKRLIAEFSFNRVETPAVSELIIQSGGQYTAQYLDLTKDFYLFA